MPPPALLRAPPQPQMSPGAAVASPVPYVVVLSELSPRAKAQYSRFLIENDVKFARRPVDGKYVANVRLEASPPAITGRNGSATPVRSPRPIQAPGNDMQAVESSDDDDNKDNNNDDDCNLDDSYVEESREDDAIPSRLRRYEALLQQSGSTKPCQRVGAGSYTSESKLVRLINDIYDARSEETLSVPVTGTNTGEESETPAAFAGFIRLFLKKNRFGLKTLVDQQALELVEGLNAHQTRQDVELFSSFLDGKYDDTALQFFLRVRNAAQHEISSASALFRPTSAASARRRGNDRGNHPQRRISKTNSTATTKALWLSKTQIESIAQRVFGAKSDDCFLQFVYDVRCFVVNHPATRSMQKLLELDEFLAVAVESFVNSQPSATAVKSSISLNSSISKHALDGLGFSDASSSPSPLPPPPLPREFGSSVLRTRPVITVQNPVVATLECTVREKPMPQDLRTAQVRDIATAPVPTGIKVAPLRKEHHENEQTVKPTGDEVQQRLSSLLARMQHRKLDGDP